MIQHALFPLAGTPASGSQQTGSMNVTVDEMFSTATRIQLDDTSWVDHIHGWLAGGHELADAVMKEAPREQRSRWMYTRVVQEPRLTAEYPVIADAPLPIVRHIAEVLAARYGRRCTRLWMNWYRDHDDGTGWHADRPANKQAEAVIPVLSLGATRPFLVRPGSGGQARRSSRAPGT
jgi:alkylated DNA repair dioxygenase AlkB